MVDLDCWIINRPKIGRNRINYGHFDLSSLEETMKKILFFISILLFLNCGGGGTTNYCDDPDATEFTATNVNDTSDDGVLSGCNFNLRSTFTACADENLNVSIVGFVDANEVINCTVEADSENIFSFDGFVCVYDVDEYVCYAEITESGEPSGSIFCNQGTLDAPESNCLITYD